MSLCNISNRFNKIKGKLEQREKGERIEGIAFVMKKNVLNGADCKAPMLDRFAEILGNSISFQLISSTHTDPGLFHLLLLICSCLC